MGFSMWQNMFNKELEALNKRIDDFSKILTTQMKSSSRPVPNQMPGPPVPVAPLNVEKLENDIFPTGKSQIEHSTYLDRYFALGMRTQEFTCSKLCGKSYA